MHKSYPAIKMSTHPPNYHLPFMTEITEKTLLHHHSASTLLPFTPHPTAVWPQPNKGHSKVITDLHVAKFSEFSLGSTFTYVLSWNAPSLFFPMPALPWSFICVFICSPLASFEGPSFSVSLCSVHSLPDFALTFLISSHTCVPGSLIHFCGCGSWPGARESQFYVSILNKGLRPDLCLSLPAGHLNFHLWNHWIQCV